MIDQFVADVWRRYPEANEVAVSVAEGNRRSWRALEKAGFVHSWTGELESDDPGDAGVSVVHVRKRPRPDDVADYFRSLHYGSEPLLLPNPWDAGSARVLASLGFEALATTSSGCAATMGRLDGSVSRHEALAHAESIVDATGLPVSADLEHGFADDPAGVAETVRLACDCGLAGLSIEDCSAEPERAIYDLELAAERVAAAAEAAHGASQRLVLTARAENYLRGRPDLPDTIERLQRFQQAGADVLYAPGLSSLDDIRQIVAAVDRPVNVIGRPGAPSVSELASVGVKRVSVGGAFAFAALGALVEAARELKEYGTYSYTERSQIGSEQARIAFHR
jgi:2-methylisocitrate lyase-like PEP mutase family enzyme